MFWSNASFDLLGRVTQQTMPRGDDDNSLLTSVTTSYDGLYTTVTDQAGKVRRQKADALGRVVRLDEPTTSGLGSTSSPNQATDYYYDAVDNLVRVNQGSQNRYFKYDSLSRLIRERQTEQAVNSDYNLSDSLTSNSSWTRKIVYNSNSLITNVYDARGVQASFTYDDLNRVTQISYSDSTPTAHYYYDSQSLPSGAPSTSAPDSYS
jgi:YD repeat-containing protein